MNCKEFERLIPDFIQKKMDFLTLKQFQEHIDTCANCKEELVIQFLITEGIQHLENGEVFDLQQELDLRISEAKRKIKIHTNFLKVGVFLEVIAVLAVAGGMIWIII